jgi:hypothetical protein
MFGYVWRLVWKTKFRVVAKDAKTMIGSGQSGMAEHSITARKTAGGPLVKTHAKRGTHN